VQWRSQEFARGGRGLWRGLGAKTKPPAPGGKGAWVRSPSSGQFLQFFNKNNAFLRVFRPK